MSDQIDTCDRESLDYIEYLKTVMKGKTDPVWFVESQVGARLFPKQNEIMSEFYGNLYKNLFIVAGMRGGKSALAGMIGVYELFDLMTIENPATYFGLLPDQQINISVVATSTTQAQDSIFGNICSMVESSDWFGTWTDLKIRNEEIRSKRKKVVMRVLSSWSTTAVGRSNKAVIFDELDNFEDTSGKRGAWEIYGRLSKSTDTFGDSGKIMAISSPKSPSGIMMTLYRQGLKDSKTLSILAPTWEMNPNLTKEILMAEHKHNLGMFWRDYGCSPQIFTAIQFPEGVRLNKGLNNVLHNMPVHGDDKLRVCAIDPAVKNDSFGIGVGYREGNRIVVDGVRRFIREEGDAYIRPSDVRSFVDDVINRCGVQTMIFDTWMFPELIEHVEVDFGLETIKHIVGKEDYDRWRELQEGGDAKVVYDELLEEEANQLVIIESNRSRVDHPYGGSKDMADCVANIMWYLSTQEIESQIPPITVMRGF